MRATTMVPMADIPTTRRQVVFGGAAAWLVLPALVAGQPSRRSTVPRIGFVSAGSPNPPGQDPFLRGLREAGYVDGIDVVVDARYARGQQEQVPRLVAEAIRQKVDVLVVVSTSTAVAAKQATSTIPIVFTSVFDPVAAGLVPSLTRPGGNVTGVAMGVGGGFGGKWLELLRELVPDLSRAAVLWNSRNRSSAQSADEIQAAARRVNVRLAMVDAGIHPGLDQALGAIAASRPQGMIVAPDPSFNAGRSTIVRFAADQKLPAVYFFAAFVEAGGLAAYGANNDDAIRAAATYVDRILKGAKPGDLPVEQPTRFELAINLAAARGLGRNVPQALIVRADRIVE